MVADGAAFRQAHAKLDIRQPVEALSGIPSDLLSRLGLQRLIRMNRAVGLSAITGRFKNFAKNADRE